MLTVEIENKNGIANLSEMTIVISEQTATISDPSDMLLFGLCLTGIGIAVCALLCSPNLYLHV